MEHTNDTFLKTQAALKEIIEKLIDLSKDDLSNIHVGQEWSWIPYAGDHLNFLIEQAVGVCGALQEGPPPVASEDLARLAEKTTKT